MVKVVPVMADASEVNEMFCKCIDIFTDAKLLRLGNKELMPFPRKGVMAPEPYRNTILEHFNFCRMIAAISITSGFFKKNTNLITTRANLQCVKMIQKMLLEEITDENGFLYFMTLEPTKFSASEGRYLLFTQKERQGMPSKLWMTLSHGCMLTTYRTPLFSQT